MKNFKMCGVPIRTKPLFGSGEIQDQVYLVNLDKIWTHTVIFSKFFCDTFFYATLYTFEIKIFLNNKNNSDRTQVFS